MTNFIAITYLFTLGYLPFNQLSVNGDTFHEYGSNTIQLEIGVEFFDTVNFYGGQKSKQTARGSLFNYDPYQQKYYIGAQAHYDFKNATFFGGIERSCEHPVYTWGGTNHTVLDAASLELYGGIKGKIPVLKR